MSIQRLVTLPDMFHGKKVRVVGYAWVQFESQGLSPSKDQADTKGCLWVDFDRERDKDLDGRRVVVEGTFDGLSFGHWSAYGATIKDVTRAEPLDPVYVRLPDGGLPDD